MTSMPSKQMGNQPSKRPQFFKLVKRDRYLLLMLLPIAIYYIIFHYLPMTGIIIAFKNFVPGRGIYYGEWVGLKWFRQFMSSPYFFRLIRNTVLISGYSILFGFPVPILFAVCVCEVSNMRNRRILQTVSYLPHFISTVVLVGMLRSFFAVDNGIVNVVRSSMGLEQIPFFQDPKYFRSLYVGSGIWQSFGWNSIIYIAAIAGIDPELYEAAEIDGITRAGKVRYITIPMIQSTIVLLFIMRLGSLMNVGFEKVFLMYNTAVYETADVISTYVYRKGINDAEYSFATAVGLFNSVVNFMFVFASNQLSRRITGAGLW